jgi:formate dehydrogenase beta subunit
VIGKRVAVIGGGNVATDNARSSRRSAPRWWTWCIAAPARKCRRATMKSQGCVEEGVNFRFLLAPKKIELNDTGSSRLRITYIEDGARRARCLGPPPPGGMPAASSPRTSIW